MITAEDLRFFSIIAVSRSLAAAARQLDVTPPAVTQRLRQLETKLQVRIVDRSTRHLRLTDEGELLASRGFSILSELDLLADALNSRRGKVAGHLRVVAPFGFGRRFVAPAADAFLRNHPEIHLSLTLSENPAGLGADSWDVLIHAGELRASSLIAHRLAPNARVACASPEYLSRCPAPVVPEDLLRHDIIVLRENDEDVTLWKFSDAGRVQTAVRISPRMTSNDGEVVRQWALAGRGIAVRSEWDIADDLRNGRLVRILRNYHLPPADIVALTAARTRRAARTTIFIGELQAALNPAPWREAPER
ncbi:MAG: LysR family transcriptional regulator [Gammaproteobacteria bacterium]